MELIIAHFGIGFALASAYLYSFCKKRRDRESEDQLYPNCTYTSSGSSTVTYKIANPTKELAFSMYYCLPHATNVERGCVVVTQDPYGLKKVGWVSRAQNGKPVSVVNARRFPIYTTDKWYDTGATMTIDQWVSLNDLVQERFEWCYQDQPEILNDPTGEFFFDMFNAYWASILIPGEW